MGRGQRLVRWIKDILWGQLSPQQEKYAIQSLKRLFGIEKEGKNEITEASQKEGSQKSN